MDLFLLNLPWASLTVLILVSSAGRRVSPSPILPRRPPSNMLNLLYWQAPHWLRFKLNIRSGTWIKIFYQGPGARAPQRDERNKTWLMCTETEKINWLLKKKMNEWAIKIIVSCRNILWRAEASGGSGRFTCESTVRFIFLLHWSMIFTSHQYKNRASTF